MPDRKHTELLLSIATRDLGTLRHMQDSAAFPVEVFGFHAQHAAEKAFKAWLSFLDVEYPRIHDLEELLALLEDAGAEDAASFDDLVDLNPFAVQFRYDSFDLS